MGTNCIRLVAPKYKTLVQDLINKEQLGQDIPERLEAVGVHKDGHRVVVELRSRKIDPDIPYHIAVVRDVTASQARFERLAEASFEGILIHEKGVIIESNQQFADMIGYSLEELKGFNGLDLFTPESQEMAREKIASG
ncbi:MAG: PAS domain S-box protein, partial [Planctomycetota bacterium]